ncbi:hypothetical protein J5Y09_17240 [Roseomonas sp. PWR1]|uniref:SH3 domain-containing protein n=1 Tax=Roseomonas nitratireducens TaxID=2820810 RepID=A0ABS4AWD4_9PROT|nr:SH3 domain-containing protein [Neoroseomonas nitratireducens]MBP0465675.1 hypothetical protein [Neoroseomonas nitratireducens]
MRRIFKAGLPLALAATLAACAPASPGAPGATTAIDPSDACGRQRANFELARGLFAGAVIAGAAGGAAVGGGIAPRRGGVIIVPGSVAVAGALIGAAAGAAAGVAMADYLAERRRAAPDDAALRQTVAADIERENANLDLARNAAEFLLDCRLRAAADIRAAVADGTLTAAAAAPRLEALRAAAAADAALAQQIAARIAARDAELAPAMEALVPGARAEGADAAPAIESTTPLALPLRARPDATAVRVATLPAGTQVALRPSRDPDFVAVERPGGMRLGYVPASSFGAAAPARRAPRAEEPLRFLAATNVARRDNFAETVGDLTRAGQGQGFEPAAP